MEICSDNKKHTVGDIACSVVAPFTGIVSETGLTDCQDMVTLAVDELIAANALHHAEWSQDDGKVVFLGGGTSS